MIKSLILPSIIATSLLTGMVFTPTSFAQSTTEKTEQSSKHKMKHPLFDRHFKRIVKSLALTEAQLEKLEAIKATHMKNLPERNPENTFKTDYKTLISAPAFDEKMAQTLAQERSEKMKEIFILKIKVSHDFYQILDEEQKEKYLTMLERRGPKKNK